MIARLRSLLSGDRLGARAIRGSLLTFTGFGASMVLRLASNLILTRILFPEAFGLMALVTVVMTGLQMFSDTGIHTSIIQSKRGDDPLFMNTAWVVQIGRGLLLWIATIAAAAPLADFYDQPQLLQLLPVAGLAAVIQGFESTRLANANRHLRLGRLAILELGSQFIGILVMILLAILMQSVWALVIGGLVSAAVKTVLSHLILPGSRNRIAWERAAFSEIFHFGKYIFISSIAGFLINNADRAILGKFVSLTELAVYNIGFFIATVPIVLTRQFGSKILMPVYARIPPAESPSNRKKALKARALLTLSMMAIAILLGLGGDVLIRHLYTEPYHLGGPILVLLSLSYLPSIVTNAYGTLFLAAGNSRDFTVLLIVMAIVQSLVLLFGVQSLGLMGAILAPAVATLVLYPLTAWLAQRHGGWEPLHDTVCLGVILLATALVLWVNDTAVAQVLASHH